MATEEAFLAAIARIKMKTDVGQGDQLALYALYKQATAGDASGARPGMLDIRGRAKYDAWAGKKGLTTDQARAAYIELVDSLLKA